MRTCILTFTLFAYATAVLAAETEGNNRLIEAVNCIKDSLLPFEENIPEIRGIEPENLEAANSLFQESVSIITSFDSSVGDSRISLNPRLPIFLNSERVVVVKIDHNPFSALFDFHENGLLVCVIIDVYGNLITALPFTQDRMRIKDTAALQLLLQTCYNPSALRIERVRRPGKKVKNSDSQKRVPYKTTPIVLAPSIDEESLFGEFLLNIKLKISWGVSNVYMINATVRSAFNKLIKKLNDQFEGTDKDPNTTLAIRYDFRFPLLKKNDGTLILVVSDKETGNLSLGVYEVEDVLYGVIIDDYDRPGGSGVFLPPSTSLPLRDVILSKYRFLDRFPKNLARLIKYWEKYKFPLMEQVMVSLFTGALGLKNRYIDIRMKDDALVFKKGQSSISISIDGYVLCLSDNKTNESVFFNENFVLNDY